MSGKRLLKILKPLSVPAGLLVASAIYPFRPIIQQAFIGITLVWFGIIAMTSMNV
jgi:hypothetical protein